MQQPDRETQISSEVVGRLTDSQKQQLSGLALQIIAGLGLEAGNRDHQLTATTVVSDLFNEGLRASGRVWIREEESVAQVFGAGRENRQSLIKSTTVLVSSPIYRPFFSDNDIAFLNKVKTFSPDFAHLAEIRDHVLAQWGIITKFQTELFEKSSLAEDAAQLRSQIGQEEPGKVESMTIEERLFSNLLVHAALYHRPGILIEPEDLASMSALLSDESVADRVRDDIAKQMVQIASLLNLSGDPRLVASAVRRYTDSVFKYIDQLLAGGVTLETLTTSTQFAIPKEVLASRSEEFATETATDIYLSRLEVAQARLKALKLKEDLANWEKLIQKTAESEGDELSDSKEFEQLSSKAAECSALELLILKMALEKADHSFDPKASPGSIRPPRAFEELEMTPATTYLQAIKLVCAPAIKYQPDGEKVPDFEPFEDFAVVKEEIIQRVLSEVSKDNLSLSEVAPEIPAPILLKVLDILRADILSEKDQKLLSNLDDATWYQMCVLEKVEYSLFEDSGFRFSGGSKTLEPFLALLPEEKQNNILSKLRQEIKE